MHQKSVIFVIIGTFQVKIFAARLKQANLVTKTDFDDKLKSLNQKINSNKTKHLLVGNEF